MPNILTEYILIQETINGDDRQDLHNKLSHMRPDQIIGTARNMKISMWPTDHIGCSIQQIDDYLNHL